jgi:V/A-type H+-transporting ATPase subunit I
MIISMKKVTVLVSHISKDDSLKELRELGVMHVTPLKTIPSEKGFLIEEEIQAINKTLMYLPSHPEKKHKPIDKPVQDLALEILDLQKKKEELQVYKEQCLGKLDWYENWGKISLASLEVITEGGLYIRFYSASSSFLKTILEDKNIFIVNQNKNIIRLIYISKDADDRLNLKEEILPDMEYQEVEDEIKRVENDIREIDSKFIELSGNRKQLEEYEKELFKHLEFEKVWSGMADEKLFCYLQGFVPKNDVAAIKKKADENGWAYLIEEPGYEDDVPTLIRNPKWMEIIKPVFSLMGTIPGYREFDISFWFLLFFTFFVAMLIGDAGYGVIFLIIGFLTYPKLKIVNNNLSFLLFTLSVATIAWGTLSGTWFGSPEIANISWFRQFVIPEISSFNIANEFSDNQNFIMEMCLLIGVIHLTFAHLILAFKHLNSLRVVGQLGWIGLVWALYFLAIYLIFSKPMPSYNLLLLGCSAGLALFFSNAERNVVKSIMKAFRVESFFSFILSIISSFSDIVSYLRLFAVGFATVVVAYSFNLMAFGDGINSVGTGITAVLIFIVGHSLNIILALMAIIVHGIRLNMLEFSGHLNMEWSGYEFKPFKK